MTTQQLETALLGAVMSMMGAPVLVLHAFFHRPERLITPKRLRVVLHVLGAAVFMPLSGAFIYVYLPNWEWLQWVNVASFVLALLVSWRRLRVWYVCAYGVNNELSATSLALVMRLMSDRLGYNLTLTRTGAVHMRLIVASLPEVRRTFRLTQLTPTQLLTTMVGTLSAMPGTDMVREDHGDITTIRTVRRTRNGLQVVVS